jgi:hypothetical protein
VQRENPTGKCLRSRCCAARCLRCERGRSARTKSSCIASKRCAMPSGCSCPAVGDSRIFRLRGSSLAPLGRHAADGTNDRCYAAK